MLEEKLYYAQITTNRERPSIETYFKRNNAFIIRKIEAPKTLSGNEILQHDETFYHLRHCTFVHITSGMIHNHVITVYGAKKDVENEIIKIKKAIPDTFDHEPYLVR